MISGSIKKQYLDNEFLPNNEARISVAIFSTVQANDFQERAFVELESAGCYLNNE
jgi:hypothetical protein